MDLQEERLGTSHCRLSLADKLSAHVCRWKSSAPEARLIAAMRSTTLRYRTYFQALGRPHAHRDKGREIHGVDGCDEEAVREGWGWERGP